MDLSNELAIVTGAGRGIDREIAIALATAGARVAVTSRTRSELAETVKLAGANGSRMLVAPADVTDYDALRSLATEVNERLGPVTLLINNAGVCDSASPSCSAWFYLDLLPGRLGLGTETVSFSLWEIALSVVGSHRV